MKYSAKTVLSFRKGLDSINMGIYLKNTLDLKTPLPRGGGFRNTLVCKDFKFCCSFRGKPDKQLD